MSHVCSMISKKFLQFQWRILDLTQDVPSSQIARQSAVQNEELGSPKKPFTGCLFGGNQKRLLKSFVRNWVQIGEFIGDVLRCLTAAETMESISLICSPCSVWLLKYAGYLWIIPRDHDPRFWIIFFWNRKATLWFHAEKCGRWTWYNPTCDTTVVGEDTI